LSTKQFNNLKESILKIVRRALLIAAIVGVVAGCASGPKYAEMKSKIPAMKAGEGRIFIYRDSIFGAAVQPKVSINGVEVGTSQSNGFFYIDRPAGDYKISGSTEVERSVSFVLAAGETKYIQSSISMGLLVGRINFELVNAAGGEAAVSGLSYTGK
jgi:Protein of unknown function (DUF2846)